MRSGERKGHSLSWIEVLQLLGSRRNGKIKDVFLWGTTKKKKNNEAQEGGWGIDGAKRMCSCFNEKREAGAAWLPGPHTV